MISRLRSVLFAPATRPDMLRKLPHSRPDAVVIDLEDAVPPDAKLDARVNAREVGAELTRLPDGPAVFVRVNGVATDWFAADVTDALCDGLAGVWVPKLEKTVHVDRVVGALSRVARADLAIGVGIETAVGVLNASELLSSGVDVAYFGAEDFVTDVGGVRRTDNVEVLYARSHVAVAGRVAGVPLVDMVVTDFGDDDRFRREAAEARALGYRGKVCIHPGQVALANEAFVPTTEEIARAHRIVVAYDAAITDGHAAIAVDGQMIDEPLARQARAVLDSAY